jgi:hypothetical protein
MRYEALALNYLCEQEWTLSDRMYLHCHGPRCRMQGIGCFRQATERRTTRRLSLGRTYIGSSYLPFTPPVGNIVPGVFTPVLAKHSKSFSLIDCVSVGVDRMQRNFEPMRKQVEAW